MRIASVVILILISVFTVSSQTNSKIKELERKRKLALKEIENTTVLLSQAKKSTATLLTRINLIAEQINSRQSLIDLLGKEIDAISEQQTLTQKEINALEVDLKSQQKAYSKALENVVLKKQKTNKLLYVLSGKSLGESMRRMKYLKDYSGWRSQQIVDIRAKQDTLIRKKQDLEKSKAEKQALLDNRKQEHLKLQDEEKQQKEEIAQANKKQAELQSILQKKQKQADNLNAQIERLIAEEVARQEREAKRQAEEQARREKARQEQARKEAEKRAKEGKAPVTPEPGTKKSEEALMPAITLENTKLSSNFASNKGRLPMPVTGAYRIVGRFGKHVHNQWKVTTNSSGVDIQAQSGAQARAVFDGEVSRVVAFPGYNNCVIVRHGGYYTFYGNIQQVSVRQGQKVSTGQSLGVVYTDSDTGSSQLHFQLWKGTTKLNPEPWLQK
ncbi:MAG TPA: hypothetical protein DIT04_01295 [Dysgonomonas sp.]|nr:hypothetical protein [Dysgonomonas sp.]